MSNQRLDNPGRLSGDAPLAEAGVDNASSSAFAGNFLRPPDVQSVNAVKTDDQQLISECLSGCTEAFGRLVERYQQRLYGTLVHVLGSAEEAQDVAQDAFVHAFQKLETFRGQAAFYSWLYRIAMNTAVSRQRKNKRFKASVDAAKELVGTEPSDRHHGAHPSHALEQKERRHLVQEALSQLSDEFRTVLVLKEMEGLKYEEIAEIVDCPIGTVRSRIHRARLELKQKLENLRRDEHL